MGTKTPQSDFSIRWDARCRNEEAAWIIHTRREHEMLQNRLGRRPSDGDILDLHLKLVKNWSY